MSERRSSAHDAAARFLPLLVGLDQGDLSISHGLCELCSAYYYGSAQLGG